MALLNGKFLQSNSLDGSKVVDASIGNAKIAVDAAIVESKLDLDYSTSSLNTAISDHINDTSAAHAASAISIADANNQFTGTTVEAALDEALDAAQAAQVTASAAIPASEKGANSGVATLDAGGKVPVSQLPNSVMEFQGTWNATTNTPTLVDGTGNLGDVYWVTVAGTQNLGSGSQDFAVGDFVIYNSSADWQKSINSNAVVSVNGAQGVVVLDAGDIGIADASSQFTSTVVEGALDEAMDAAQAAQADATQALADAATADGKAVAAQDDVDDLVTLSGVAVNATDLGTFTGSTIANNSDIKEALQALETEVETKLDSASLPTYRAQLFALVAQDITNQYIDLAEEISSSASLTVFAEGVPQKLTSDYTLSVEGGVTRITFAGDMASLLAATDEVLCTYTY
jgi:uncharacterized protein YqgV (UPF0045/DUF77 family)